MDKLNSMRIFIEVVRSEGFSAAANRLNLSRAQVSKSVMQLEQSLGTRLLNRTTRRISLTDDGRQYFERCEVILNDIDELDEMISNVSAVPTGRLQVCAPTSFGTLHLARAIPDYCGRYPRVQLAVSLTDRFVDVVAEGFDVAIRIAELADSSLVARHVAPCRRVFCASPDYLRRHGKPVVPADLTSHQCLVYSNEIRPDLWTLYGPDGEEAVRVKGPVCADNGDILRDAALSALGITLLPTFIVGPDIAAGRLVQVLPEYCPPEISIYAIFPSRRFLSAKVRSFVDFISDYFGKQPEWDRFS